MKVIRDITCFDFIDDKLVYASKDAIHWISESILIQNVRFFLQTKDYLVIVTNNKNTGFSIEKKQLNDNLADLTKIPQCVSPLSYNFTENLLTLFSGIFQDETSWIYSLDDGAEEIYENRIQFVPDSNFIYTYDSPMPFFDRSTKMKLQELPYSLNEQTSIPQVLGLVDNTVWIRMDEDELTGLDLKTGAKETLNPYTMISSQGVDPLYIGFGGETNRYRFHVDTAGKRIVTFANRYYCEISLIDFSVKVIDLFLLSPLQISIVKSRWCPESKWLYFIGRAKGDRFEKYMGVFDTVSGTFLQLDRIEDKDGFFGHPPLFGKGIYGALADNVLYIKEISPH